MTAEDLLSTVQLDLWEFEPRERQDLLGRLYFRARSLGVEAEFDRLISSNFDSEYQYGIDKCNMTESDVYMLLETDGKGKALSTLNNFITILRKDPFFFGLRLNELSGRAEQCTSKKSIKWTDADDARAMNYIENQFGLYNENKYYHRGAYQAYKEINNLNN